MKSLHPLHGRPQTVTAGDRGKSQTNAQGLLPLVQRADRSRPPQSAPWGRTLAWYPDRGARENGEHSIRPWAPSWAELATGGRGAKSVAPSRTCFLEEAASSQRLVHYKYSVMFIIHVYLCYNISFLIMYPQLLGHCLLLRIWSANMCWMAECSHISSGWPLRKPAQIHRRW